LTQDPRFLLLIGALVVARFLFRELRERKLSTGQLYVLPAFIGAIALLSIAVTVGVMPGRGAELALEMGLAVPVGALFGLGVAHFTTVRIGPDGTVLFKGSYVTVAFWIAALALRMGLRYVVAGVHSLAETTVANTALVVLIFVALTLVRVRVYFKGQDEKRKGTLEPQPAI
jgi:hypothetical protein